MNPCSDTPPLALADASHPRFADWSDRIDAFIKHSGRKNLCRGAEAATELLLEMHTQQAHLSPLVTSETSVAVPEENITAFLLAMHRFLQDFTPAEPKNSTPRLPQDRAYGVELHTDSTGQLWLVLREHRNVSGAAAPSEALGDKMSAWMAVALAAQEVWLSQAQEVGRESTASLKTASTPVPYINDAPVLHYDPPVMDRSRISVIDLGNVLITGDTGVGKTISHVLPHLRSALQASSQGLQSAMVVIDPKAELLDHTLQCAQAFHRIDDVMVIGAPGTPPLHSHQYGDGKSARERLEDIYTMVAKANADSSNDSQWMQKTKAFVLAALTLNRAVRIASGGQGMFQILLQGLNKEVPVGEWNQLNTLLLRTGHTATEIRWLEQTATAVCLALKLTEITNPWSQYARLEPSMAVEQLMYVARNGHWVQTIADAEATGFIEFPLWPALDAQYLNLRRVCDEGKVVVFQPGTNETHTLIARLLKTQFFEAVTHRREMRRPQFYLADEFQRVITNDEATGEHAFLDRCRAYRCNAILATQSLEALRSQASDARVRAIVANCRTKVFMRSSDGATLQLVTESLPGPRNSTLPHITRVRPLNSLRIGQAYYRHNDQWGLSQYQPRDL